MNSFSPLLYIVFAIALLSSYCSRGEQLSTVFVLEASDSPSESIIPGIIGESTSISSNLEDSNTRIITDDAASNQQAKKDRHLEHEPSHAQHKPTPVAAHHGNQPNHSPNSTHQQSHTVNQHNPKSGHEGKPSNGTQHSAPTNHTVSHHNNNANTNHNEIHHEAHQEPPASASRRLEEESQVVPNTRHRASTTTRSTNQQQAHHQAYTTTGSSVGHQQKPKPASSTAPTNTNNYQDDSVSNTPKTEERLLISITSDDDEEFKPPRGSISSSGGQIINPDEHLQVPQQGQAQPHKRKPSITISIQDANLIKEGGGSGSVIVRPSENGQSIVISTVANHNNNKHTQVSANGGAHKPSIAIVSSSGSSGQQHGSNNGQPPYREPVEIPVHIVSGNSNNNNNNNHQIYTTSSTTYRPALVSNDNYNPPAGPVNRPITSSLIEQASSNQGSIDSERPQRPAVLQPAEDAYERPSSRPVMPVKPPVEPISGGYGADQQDGAELSRPVNENSSPSTGESKYPLNERNCGLVHETRIVGGEEANPDDFLWMAAIIKSKPTSGESRPFCGGSLITRRHILTAAHCLENLAPRDVLVRLGSYDFDDSTASSLSADFAIDQFRVPAQYSKKTHAADIAIMRLKTPLAATDNYKTVCMSQPRRSYVGVLGTVTGYGSQSQTFRRAAPKLRQVTVPIWENRKCSVVYKKNLTESFLCAGYEEGGKDACQGDSGGPLMTEGPNERMMIVGVVSHGIGCGSPGYPGVYTRTTTYLDWIEKNTRE